MRLGEMDIHLERDVFLRSLIRELSGVLEDVVDIKKLRDLSALSRVIFPVRRRSFYR